jgi:hypothetical protein
MAEAKRRGCGEDGICLDRRGDCRDSAHHRTCTGRWRGVVSLGYAANGKRIRKKVSGQTRTEVEDKLAALHSELDAGVRTVQGYTAEGAVTDWLADPAAGPDRPGRPHRPGQDVPKKLRTGTWRPAAAGGQPRHEPVRVRPARPVRSKDLSPGQTGGPLPSGRILFRR